MAKKKALVESVELKAQLGVKEFKELLQLVFALAKVFKMAKLNDGKITTADLSLLVNAFPVVGPAIEGIDQVLPELKDMDMAELKEIVIFSAAHLQENVNSETVMFKIEKGVAAVVALIELYKAMTMPVVMPEVKVEGADAL